MDKKIERSNSFRLKDAFQGINKYRVDARGRLTVPTKFREIIDGKYGGKLFITMNVMGMSICVYPYSLAEEMYENSPNVAAHGDTVSTGFNEFVLPGEECEPDAQGRLLIPLMLRESAGIAVNQDAVVVGKGTRFDVWNAEKWQLQRELWKKEISVAKPEEFKSVLTALGMSNL